MECGPPNMAAPGFGPRPPCYVPEWSPTQWLGNPQNPQNAQIPKIPHYQMPQMPMPQNRS